MISNDMSLCDLSLEDMMGSMALSEPVIYILLSLAAGPQHGYAILKDVAQLSERRIKLSTGTLYGALARLLDDRWIERVAEQDAPRGRQKYRLSAAGRKALAAEVASLQRISAVGMKRLKPRVL